MIMQLSIACNFWLLNVIAYLTCFPNGVLQHHAKSFQSRVELICRVQFVSVSAKTARRLQARRIEFTFPVK